MIHENRDIKVLECQDENILSRLRNQVKNYKEFTKLAFPKFYPASLMLSYKSTKRKLDINRYKDNEVSIASKDNYYCIFQIICDYRNFGIHFDLLKNTPHG